MELVDLAPFPDLVDMPEKENENSETLFCFGESCGERTRNVRQVYLLTQWTNTKFEFDVMVIFNKKRNVYRLRGQILCLTLISISFT